MNLLRSWAKILGLIVGGVLALVLTAFGALLAINAFDESLGPGPRAALEARHDSISPADNLFFAVLGLGFQGDADTNELGREVYAKYLEASRASPGQGRRAALAPHSLGRRPPGSIRGDQAVRTTRGSN